MRPIRVAAVAIPGLVNAKGDFARDPVSTGIRYFFQPALRPNCAPKSDAQFDRFRATGLPLDHLNGHLHLHLHPTVFGILVEESASLGWNRFRLTRDPFWLNLSSGAGRLVYRAANALILSALSASALPALRRRRRGTPTVFLAYSRTSSERASSCDLLERLPPGDSELYSHPSLDEFGHEFEAIDQPAGAFASPGFGNPTDPLPRPVNGSVRWLVTTRKGVRNACVAEN